MSRYQFEVVWQQVDDDLRREVVDFWLKQGALPNEQAGHERADQLLTVCRDQNGSLVGVSTAVVRDISQLGFPCYYYRLFVNPRYRLAYLTSELIDKGFTALKQGFRAGENPEVLGIYMEIQNPKIMKAINHLVFRRIRGHELIYIGKTEAGNHIRVCYFDEARLGADPQENQA